MKGKFITFEGCEGAGKSTQIILLKNYLNSSGFPIFFTREPGGTKISEDIRSLILDPQNHEMDAITELMLYSASRRQLTVEVIKQKLESGITVICDRYIDSTTAYQGFARGLNLELIHSLNNWAMDGITIDFTVFLDVPPDKGFMRKKRTNDYDRLELEKEEFHKKVYEGYKWILSHEQDRLVRIDGTMPRQEVFNQIVRLFIERGVLS